MIGGVKPDGGMMKSRLSLLCMLFLCLVPLAAASGAEDAEVIVAGGIGSINWSRGIIQVIGRAEQIADTSQTQHPALAKARIDAQEKLLRLIRSVNIDSDTTIGDRLQKDGGLRERTAALVEALKPVGLPEFRSDGTVEVILELPFTGSLSEMMLPQEIKQIEPLKTVGPVKTQSPAPAAESSGTAAAPAALKKTSDVFSGMIVDAKGLSEFRPALVPKIVDETGKEIYGPAFVSREHAVTSGMTRYLKSLGRAKNHPRVKPNPLIVKGLKTDTLGCSVIVVSNADALKLRHASEHLSFLKRCRVIILLD